jgi:hypothetical protein
MSPDCSDDAEPRWAVVGEIVGLALRWQYPSCSGPVSFAQIPFIRICGRDGARAAERDLQDNDRRAWDTGHARRSGDTSAPA